MNRIQGTKKYIRISWLLILLFYCNLLLSQTDLNSFDFVVSKDGSTPYSTLQGVLNQIPSGNLRPYKIFLKKGIYK